MTAKFLFVICAMVAGYSDRILAGVITSTQNGYQLNDTSAEMVMTEDPGPPDSHEAMNNRDFKSHLRKKRSFEFLVGLVNNNSKYEVIRSDPALASDKISKITENHNTDATQLLLDLLAKIVTYPDRWRQIHKILRSLDQDLISSDNILRHQKQLEEKYLETNMKRKIENISDQHHKNLLDLSSTTIKWPTFDDIDPDSVTSTETAFVKKEAKSSENKSLQKNFAYHKVTVSGKPAHLKKNPTAYIAVSAISPKPSEPEEDLILETELHQLKPWKNKVTTKNV